MYKVSVEVGSGEQNIGSGRPEINGSDRILTTENMSVSVGNL